MKKLPWFLKNRRHIAMQYDRAFVDIKEIAPLHVTMNVLHAYHLYIVRIQDGLNRKKLFQHLWNAGIGVNVHYIPLNYHPFYQKTLGYKKGDFPKAEAAYEEIISLPIFPEMTDDNVNAVIDSIKLYTETN
jgi:perosamine synthetase